jgi:hypothetical protein
MFKFEGNQKVFLGETEVTIFGRTEFFTGKQPRYYVTAEQALPGSNSNEAWVNEDMLSAVAPAPKAAPAEAAKASVAQKGKKGIRTKGWSA